MATVVELLTGLLVQTQYANRQQREFYSVAKQNIRASLGLPGIGGPFGFAAAIGGLVRERQAVVAALQKQTLAFGTTTAALQKVEKVREGVDKFGPTIALTVATNALATGNRNASKQMLNLGMEMQAVGENSRQLFTSLREAAVMGGLSTEGSDRLVASLKEARDVYGISTDALTNAMADLGDKFADFNILGQTEEIQKTQLDLVKKLGAGSESLITQAIKAATSGGKLVTFQRFGALEERGRFASGPTAEALLSLANKIGPQFKDIVDKFTSGMIDEYEALKMAEDRFGAEGKVFYQLYQAQLKALGPAAKSLQDGVGKAANQIDIQKDIAKSAVDDLANFANTINATAMQWAFGAAAFLNAVNTFRAAAALGAPAGASGGAGGIGRGRLIGAGIGLAALTVVPQLLQKGLEKEDHSNKTFVSWTTKVVQGIMLLVALQQATGSANLFAAIPSLIGRIGPMLIGLFAGGGIIATLLPILLGAGLVGLVGYGIYKALSDEKDKKPEEIEVLKPEGELLQTNQYMAASTEVTKTLLSAAFRQPQDAQVKELKKSVAVQEQMNKTLMKLLGTNVLTGVATAGFSSTALGSSK